MWQYYNPVKIFFTEEFIEELTGLIDDKQKILLICSKRFTNTSEFFQIKSNVDSFDLFTEIENEPSFVSCNRAIDFANELQPTMIIAIGGGSVIDTAKAVRLSLMTKSFCIEDMLDGKLSYLEKIEFVTIPTTHGTASELTKWATIWNKKEKKKYSLSHNMNYPDYAIYDYHFVQNLPLDISLITTLDALSHSFEALWNINANPISDDYAIRAIKLIIENIRKLSIKTDINIRISLLKATMYSGLAFSNTKTAAAHSISYPLTALYGIPHGIACSITLKNLFEYNHNAIKDKVKKLLKQMNFTDAKEIWDIVDNVVTNKIKYSLADYGITINDLDLIVSKSFSKDRMGNNIVALSKNDIFNILNEFGEV